MAAAAPEPRSSPSTCPAPAGARPGDLPGSVDVVVVGAGLAGLTAALRLSAAGRRTLVLEASDGVGGRARTDLVDGYRIDRGFQVLNTAYPQVRREIDLLALDVRPFVRGARVVTEQASTLVADPRSSLLGPLGLLHPPVGSLRVASRLALLSAQAAVGPVDRLLAGPDRSTADELAARGLTGPVLESFLRPFLAGVFLEDGLETSSRFFLLVWRTFLRGTIGVPATGMGQIAAQLAARLPPDTLHLGTAVRSVAPGHVVTDAGRVVARAVLVATDPGTAADLLPGLERPQMRAVTTWYHSAAATPAERTGHGSVIRLDGRGVARGPVVTSVVLTDSAPGYAPAGRRLLASSVLGTEPVDEASVRHEVGFLHGRPIDDLELVARVHVAGALPASLPPLGGLRRPVDLGDGVFVAGDHRDTPSIQGAMASGHRAAGSVLRRLGALASAAALRP